MSSSVNSVFDPLAYWQLQLLPWQIDAFCNLAQMIRQGRLPHALLLAGSRGVGKGVFAGAIAALIMCREKGDVACGRCKSCTLAACGSHGDFYWLAPESGKRAIGIELVRGAIHFIQQTAGYGDAKVLVINPAESMTIAAANALLKTLEEPAGNSHLVLVSHRPGDLLATVRSRCQTVVLGAPSYQESLDWLKTSVLLRRGKTDTNEQGICQALRAVDGRPLDALDLLLNGNAEERLQLRKIFEDVISNVRSPSSAVTELAKFELELLLEVSASKVAELLYQANSEVLRLGSAAFFCHDRILCWLSASRRGVNLNRDLLVCELCRNLSRFGVLKIEYS